MKFPVKNYYYYTDDEVMLQTQGRKWRKLFFKEKSAICSIKLLNCFFALIDEQNLKWFYKYKMNYTDF